MLITKGESNSDITGSGESNSGKHDDESNFGGNPSSNYMQYEIYMTKSNQ